MTAFGEAGVGSYAGLVPSGATGQNSGSDTVPANTSTGYSISVGGTVNGYVNTGGDQDWYRVTLTAGQTYTITLTGSGGLDSYVRLLDASGSQLAFDDDSGPAYDSRLVFTASTTGTYYISAQGYSASTGGYSLSLTEGSTGLPVFTIPQISDQLINGYWAWSGGGSRHWAATNTNITYNVQGLTAERAATARLAFATWQEACGLTFTETTGTAEITLDDTQSGAYASSTTSGGIILSSIINVEPGWFGGSSAMDSYTFQTFIHEIGHTLGLGHGGNYNGSATYGVDNHYANDTWQYSIMSYMEQNNFGGASYRYVMTPQMADIFAVNQLYGLGTARSGNTVYGFNASGHSATTAAIYNFSSYTTPPCFTIYDTGGTDTLDCSGYSNNTLISLVGGTWSNIGGLIGNIGIYTTSVIENATGGSGSETFIGNSANNTFRGGGGTDTINGGAGWDRTIVNFASTAATISQNSSTLAWTISGAGQTEILTNVEVIQFSNGVTRALRERPRSDFDGNNGSDILWRNSAGTVSIWQLNNGQLTAYAGGWATGADWSCRGTGDFNGDGVTDILWRNTSGVVSLWQLNSNAQLSSVVGGWATGSDWSALGVGDFNRDGTSDILWRNTNGNISIWNMNNGQISAYTGGWTVGANWSFQGIGDFNGDGTSDILWRNTAGIVSIWNMSNSQISAIAGGWATGTDWNTGGVGDFNGDGTSDILWRNVSGVTSIWALNNNQISSITGGWQTGTEWSIQSVSDFNANGTSDILWRNTSGVVSIWAMQNGQFTGTLGGWNAGTDWQIASG